MTLNQIIRRIKQICLAHKQLRNFYFGHVTDFLTDKTTRYASSFLQDTPGSIDLTAKTITVGFKLFLLDLVNVSENSKENELDVQSDMLQIGLDLIAEMDHSGYTDWKITLSNPVILVREELDDLVAGAVIDFSVQIPYNKDACVVPTEELPAVINNDDMKLIYDTSYITNGTEGSTLSGSAVAEFAGKKLLLVIRENATQHKVSINPGSSEYTWDNIQIIFGTPINPETPERILFLFRNY